MGAGKEGMRRRGVAILFNFSASPGFRFFPQSSYVGFAVEREDAHIGRLE